MSLHERELLGQQNRDFYVKHLSNVTMYDDYCKLLDDVLKIQQRK